MAAVDETIIGPWLADKGGKRHAAFASLCPTVASAIGPASIREATLLPLTRSQRSLSATISTPSTGRPLLIILWAAWSHRRSPHPRPITRPSLPSALAPSTSAG